MSRFHGPDVVWFAAAIVAAAGATMLARQSPSGAKASPAIVFNFEGGDISKNAAQALKVLYDQGLLKTATASDAKSPCEAAMSHTKIPGGCSADLEKLAAQINRGATRAEGIKYPNAAFSRYAYPLQFSKKSSLDMKQLKDTKANWKSYIQSEQETERLVTLMLTGYQLRVPIEPDAHVDPDALLNLRSKNVYVHVDAGQKPPKQNYYSFTDEGIQAYDDFCTTTETLQGCYCDLIGAPAIEAPACDSASTTCPDVVLIDTPVYRHPAIASSLVDGGWPLENTPTASLPRCLPREEARKKRLYHGTSLAGIVASHGTGILSGIHPGVRLYSRDSETLTAGNGAAMAEEMSSRRKDRGAIPQIYVYASSWGFPASDSDGLLLKKPEYRWTRNLGAKRIQDTRQLWVVAAGQQDSTVDPPMEQHDLTTNLALGPMNLGDAENVVVVTACEDCRGRTMPNPGPRLVAGVNYSTVGLVHVAAPGEEIPSPASQFQYGSTSGTSAATAFVAGLASAMMTKYPGAYDPASLKARLQYTATPWIADPSVVASGVVDARTAMLDPRRDYLNGAEVELDSWCANDAEHSGVTMLDDNYKEVENAHIPTLLIQRIFEMPRVNGRRHWTIYRARLSDNFPGDVVRVGPGLPVAASTPSSVPAERRPMIRLKNQKVITLDGIHDLLVRDGRLAVRPCQVTP